jgi:hypothetical protein
MKGTSRNIWSQQLIEISAAIEQAAKTSAHGLAITTLTNGTEPCARRAAVPGVT